MFSTISAWQLLQSEFLLDLISASGENGTFMLKVQNGAFAFNVRFGILKVLK